MTTPFQKQFKNICMNLGKNNKALYGALTIAVSKGILRPTFTMMDKKQEKDSQNILQKNLIILKNFLK